ARPDAARLSAPARDGEEAPAGLKECPGSRLDWPGAREGLRVREPEGRRGEDDDGDQPRRMSRGGGRAGARRRPRPAGERHLGPLTVNALGASDRVVVPVQTEYYALEGLAQLMQSINLIKARINPSLAVAGVLLTMADSRTRLSAEVEREVRGHFGELVFTA